MVSAVRTVPDDIERPPYVLGERPGQAGAQRHHGEALDRLRVACRVGAEVLEETAAAVAPGVTTDELDAVAHEAYIRRGAYPSTLGYKSYTKALCTSVNEVVCHGIPDSRPLCEGDLVNIDVTAYIGGMHGDTSATILVGVVDEPTRALVATTREATLRAIGALRPGGDLSMVGETIQPFAHRHGYGVVRDWGGHGIGAVFHSVPHVNHGIERAPAFALVPGTTFTVEPMLTAGSEEHRLWDDGWTVVTADLLPSAQFEHTVIITEEGAEILTVTAEGSSAAGTLADLGARAT